MTWNAEVVDQLDGHWTYQLRPRLEGLTTDEYLWEPVEGCWSVRPRPSVPSPEQRGTGDFVLDYVSPAPDPAPVTTIAWRMAHLTASAVGQRVAGLLGGDPIDHDTFPYAGTAAAALVQLDEISARWIAGVRGLGDDGLLRPCGPSEAAYGNSPDLPMLAIVLHISREIIHHGAEICLMRDLYAGRGR